MEKYEKPIPEVKNFLNQDRLISELEKACSLGNHDDALRFVNDSISSFEKALKDWSSKKEMIENPNNLKVEIDLIRDLDSLGF